LFRIFNIELNFKNPASATFAEIFLFA